VTVVTCASVRECPPVRCLSLVSRRNLARPGSGQYVQSGECRICACEVNVTWVALAEEDEKLKVATSHPEISADARRRDLSFERPIDRMDGKRGMRHREVLSPAGEMGLRRRVVEQDDEYVTTAKTTLRVGSGIRTVNRCERNGRRMENRQSARALIDPDVPTPGRVQANAVSSDRLG
jgi:hypothetical protein